MRLVEYFKYVDVEGLDIQNPVQWIVSFWVCWITCCNFWSRPAASLLISKNETGINSSMRIFARRSAFDWDVLGERDTEHLLGKNVST